MKAALALAAWLLYIAPAGATTPTGWWGFDSISAPTVNDQSASGFNGTEEGSPSVVVGKIGNGMQFDGSTNDVTLLQPSGLNFIGQTNAFSIVAWINTSSASVNTECIVCKSNNTTTQYGMLTNPTTGVLSVTIGDVNSAGTGSLRDGKWHHVAMTAPAAATGLLLYVDGKVQTLTVGTGAIGTTSIAVDVLIAARRDATNADRLRVFTGILDEVKAFPSVLSAQEIAAMAAGCGQYSSMMGVGC